MRPLGQLSIDPRFKGPPDSGNGGYVAGRLAAYLDGTAAVRLHRPPALERPLDLEHLRAEFLEQARDPLPLGTGPAPDGRDMCGVEREQLLPGRLERGEVADLSTDAAVVVDAEGKRMNEPEGV